MLRFDVLDYKGADADFHYVLQHVAGVLSLNSRLRIGSRSPEGCRVNQEFTYLSRAQDFGCFFHILRPDPQNGAEAFLARRCSSHSSQVDFG